MKSRANDGTHVDDQVFAVQLYQQYKDFCWSRANHYACYGYEATDLTQDCWERILKHLEIVKTLSHAKKCVYFDTTLFNLMCTWKTKHKKASLVSYEELEERSLLPRSYNTVSLDPASDVHLTLMQLKDGLTDQEWLLLTERYLGRYTKEELAAQMGCQTNSLRTRMSRAMAKARKILER